MRFKKQDKGKRLKRWLVAVVCMLVIIPSIWVSYTKLEGMKPFINLDLLSSSVPANFEITGYIDDQKSGIKHLRVSLFQNDKETVLLDETYTAKGLLQQGTVFRAPLKIAVNAQKINISDGPATLKITAWDYAWRDWWNGNQAAIEKEIVFDTKPPVLSILSNQHNVATGGSGLVIYKLSESCPQTGVFVGDDFFPGHSGYFEDPNVYMAFFAIPFDFMKGTDVFVKAVDLAGNSGRNGFYHHIRSRNFKTDTINISENFLNWKLPEFQIVDGFPVDKTPADQFIFINSVLRARNNQKILENGKNTQNRIFWNDAFGRLPNSARRANFADHRVYKHKDTVVSNAVHMGIDLASIKHAEVPAAGNGRVVFTDYAGIYGNVVCIDHGFGLMSIYAHLSRISVKPDDPVSAGDIIGYTGTSGLAGGDHLHFAMFVDHVFVDPVEWWDPAWIKNNITDKIAGVESLNS